MRHVVLLSLITAVLVNCSDVGFETQASNGSNDATGTPNPTPTPGPTPTPSPTPSPTPTPLPKLIFYGPPCTKGSNCLVQFSLDKMWPETMTFKWRTDDELYKKTPPAGKTYAVPNVHYVPISGVITFTPGQTVKQVYVQNINQTNVEVTIGILMSECKYGATARACKDFFNQ